MIFDKYKWIETLFKRKLTQKNHSSLSNDNQFKPPWNIIFFGTDDFSLYSLRGLFNEYKRRQLIEKLEVCTVLKNQKNVVQRFALKENLRLREWPVELTKGEFHTGLVVSFGHLIPNEVIAKFPLGMINVHGSLLPRWRGAAPIIHSLANGDTTTGVSIMRIRPKKFDIGEIISQHSLEICDNMYMPELHKRLGELGSQALIECLNDLPNKIRNAKPQPKENVTFAPKVDSKFSCINWKTMSSSQIYNLERAVRGFLHVTTIWNGETIKLFEIKKTEEQALHDNRNKGFIIYDENSKLLKVLCLDKKYVTIEKVQPHKRKIMSAKDFNNGFVKKTPIEKRYFI